MLKLLFKFTAVSALCFTAIAAPGHAAVVSFDFNEPDVQINGGGTSFDYEVLNTNLAAFDSTLGTLVSATLTFGFSFTGRMPGDAANLLMGASLIPDGSTEHAAGFQAPDGSNLFDGTGPQSLAFDPISINAHILTGSPAIHEYGGSSQRIVTDSAQLAWLARDVPTVFDVGLLSGEFPAFERHSPLAVFGSVTYNYEPGVVPLPSAGVLLLAALALFGAATGRRRTA